MLLEFFAPQGLKGMAAAVQGVEFGGISPLAAQIAPLDFVGSHPCVFTHGIQYFCLIGIIQKVPKLPKVGNA